MTPPLDRWLDAFLREALELVGAERGTVLLGFAAGETISRSRGMPAGPEALAAMAEIARLAGSKAGHRSTRVAYGIDHRPGLLVTLEHQERQLGLVYLDRERRPFHDDDLRKLEALCAREAAELRARLDAPPTPAQEVRQKLEQATSKVSLDDLEKKGFRKVKVLRAGDINELIRKAVQAVFARRASPGTSEASILAEARTEVDRQLAEAKRLQLQAARIEQEKSELADAHRRLEEKVAELNRRFLAEKRALAQENEEASASIFSSALEDFFGGLEGKPPAGEPGGAHASGGEEHDARLQGLLAGLTALLHRSSTAHPECDPRQELKGLQAGLSDMIREAVGDRPGEPDLEVSPEAIGAIFVQASYRELPDAVEIRELDGGLLPEPVRSSSEQLLAEVKPAEAPLSGSLLLMAAQDRELPASEMAALEDRMAIADPILQSEWEWLARARAAVGAFEPARASVADLAALQQRVELALAGRAELGATLEQLGLPLPEAELDASASLLEAMTASWNELMAQAGLPDRPAADEVAFRARLEVDVARWIQHMPLPERQPSAATGLELAAALEEAPGSGSNAWGFVELERGELFAWVVDASGRGVESACFLLEAGAAFRAALEPGASPAAVLARVNLALSRAEAAMFASALLVRWDADARRLTLASGGHEHAAVFRTARRRVELVRAEGVVLGLGRRIPVNAFRDQAIDFAPGDALLLHTSGVIEVSGAAPEAEQRALFAAFARHGEESATGILAALREDLQRRHGPVRHDDRTLLVIKRR